MQFYAISYCSLCLWYFPGKIGKETLPLYLEAVRNFSLANTKCCLALSSLSSRKWRFATHTSRCSADITYLPIVFHNFPIVSHFLMKFFENVHTLRWIWRRSSSTSKQDRWGLCLKGSLWDFGAGALSSSGSAAAVPWQADNLPIWHENVILTSRSYKKMSHTRLPLWFLGRHRMFSLWDHELQPCFFDIVWSCLMVMEATVIALMAQSMSFRAGRSPSLWFPSLQKSCMLQMFDGCLLRHVGSEWLEDVRGISTTMYNLWSFSAVRLNLSSDVERFERKQLRSRALFWNCPTFDQFAKFTIYNIYIYIVAY